MLLLIIFVDRHNPKDRVHGLEFIVSIVGIYIIAVNFIYFLMKSFVHIVVSRCLLECKLC